MKWILLLPALASLVLASWGCTEKPRQNSDSVEENGIEYYLETDKSSYRLGESVSILYRITNKTDELKELGTVYNCESCIRQLQITSNGEVIWKSCRVPPPCGHKTFRLNPHESWEHTEVWNMINDNGTLEPDDDFSVVPGVYIVTSETGFSGENTRRPLSVSIEVK